MQTTHVPAANYRCEVKEVRELKSTGLNNSQISFELGIYRGTVRKYLLMSEDDFLGSNSYRRLYSHKLDVYEDYIRCELSSHPYLSSSQIHDRLKEHYPSFPSVNPKTVYNYVLHVRCKHGLAKSAEQSFRPYEQQPEDAYGAYGQVDFGERYLSTASGGSVKVYFLAMVLSRGCLNEFCYKFNRRYFGERVFDRLMITAVLYKSDFQHQRYGRGNCG